MPEVILRLPEVRKRTGLGRTTVYEMVSRGDFPQPIRVGLRAVGWAQSEIDAWLEGRMAQRDVA